LLLLLYTFWLERVFLYSTRIAAFSACLLTSPTVSKSDAHPSVFRYFKCIDRPIYIDYTIFGWLI